MVKILLLFSALCCTPAWAVSVRDDTGALISLPSPAQRIISLAPHLTEILFAIGAGQAVVATDQSSDYPSATNRLPRIGGSGSLDLEAIAALRPDLIVAWKSGLSQTQLAKLKKLGLVVFISEPRHISDVPDTMERLGELSGTTRSAHQAAEAFSERYHILAQRYKGRAPIRVFYQIWDRPLTTINGTHLISDVLALCGAQNVFAGLPQFTPTLSQESVILANPEIIMGASKGNTLPPWLEWWRRWPHVSAVQFNNLFFIDPDIIHRHSPRLLQGVEKLCEAVEQGRANRRSAASP